jgi:hypothetical protein
MLRLTTRVERVSPVNENIWAAIETMMRDADAALGISITRAVPSPTLTEHLLMEQFARNYDALMGLAARRMDLRMSPGGRCLAGEASLPCLAFNVAIAPASPTLPPSPGPRPPRKMVFCNDMRACYGYANRNTKISSTRGI